MIIKSITMNNKGFGRQPVKGLSRLPQSFLQRAWFLYVVGRTAQRDYFVFMVKTPSHSGPGGLVFRSKHLSI